MTELFCFSTHLFLVPCTTIYAHMGMSISTSAGCFKGFYTYSASLVSCSQCFATICLLPTAVQARDHEPLPLHQGNLWPSKVRAGSRDPRPSETHACRVITLHLVPHPINRLLSQTPATLHSALKIGQLSTHIRSFKDGFLQTKAPPYQNETRSATIGRFPLVCFTEYTIQFTCLSIIAFFPSSYLH